MKQFKYLLCIVALLFSSCASRKIQHTTDTKVVIKDSFSVKETVQYDTIVLPGDTLIQTFTIECDSLTNQPKPFQVSQKHGRSSQVITLNSKGILTAECATDSLMHVIAEKNREVAIYKALAYTKQENQVITVERCTRHKWRWYSLLLNIVLVGWVLRKPLLKGLGLLTKLVIPI